MRFIQLALLGALVASTAAFAAPSHDPSFFASFAPGVAMSAETGSDAALGAAASADLGAVIGGDRLAGIVRIGGVKQAASAYTDDWTRYRGFSGLSLAVGPSLSLVRSEPGLLELRLLAGGALARYDLSYSYFFFLYVEPGASYRVAELDDRFSLRMGLSLPAYLRADALSFGARFVAELRYASPRREGSVEPAQETTP